MANEWFILKFKANSHFKAAKNLNMLGFETFLPLNITTSRKASRFISATRPLFPGYMFIKFDKEKSNWHKINNTYGVLHLLTFNTSLVSIPSTFIDNLMKRYDSSGKLIPIVEIKEGDKVEILDGPFTNFIATVEQYEADLRIWVLMDLMGRKTKIQIPLEALQVSN